MSLESYEKAVKAIRKIINNSNVPVVCMIGFLETEKKRLMKQIENEVQRQLMRDYLNDVDDKNFVNTKGKGVT